MTIPNITIDYKAETIPDSVWEVIGPEFYRPRQHGFFKSLRKFVTKVVKYVAPIVIAYVAPGIAAAIGASGTIGSAVVGAGLGAMTSAATGGDPRMGAVLGGMAGGMAYNPSAAVTSSATPTSIFSGIGQGVSNAVGNVRDAAGNLVSSLTGSPIPTYPQHVPSYGANNPILSKVNYQGGIAGRTPMTVGNTVAAAPAAPYVPTSYGISDFQLGASPGSVEANKAIWGSGTGIMDPSQIPMNDMQAATLGNQSFIQAPVTKANLPTLDGTNRSNVGLGQVDTNMYNVDKWGVNPRHASSTAGQSAGLGYSDGPAPTFAGTAAAQNPGMMQQIKTAWAEVPQELINKFTDPKQLANTILQGGVMVAASFFGGMGGSAEEQANQQAMNQYLQELKARDAEAYSSIMEAAKNQLKMAGQFNPQYFAQLRVNLEKQKQGAQQQQLLKQAGLKTGGQQAEALRQMQIINAQDLGTAYTGGLLSGADMTTKLAGGAAGLMGKAGKGGTAYWNALTGQGTAIANQQQAQADATTGWNKTLGSLVGQNTEKDELEKERDKWKAMYEKAIA